jgi:hypothetical protein
MIDKLDEEIKALRKQAQDLEAAQNKGIVTALRDNLSKQVHPGNKKKRRGAKP